MLTSRDRQVNKIINCENFGLISMLFRVTAFVLWFIKILKSKVKNIDYNREKFLQEEEIKEARELWIKAVQLEFFIEEKEAVIKGISDPLYVKEPRCIPE